MRILASLAVLALLGVGCDPTSALPRAGLDRGVRETPSALTSPESPAATSPAAAIPVIPPVSTWPVYTGAWFQIAYPPQLAAREGTTACIEGAGCDSAFFAAPDGSVEFFVFSPLWSGDPSDDMSMDAKKERLVEKKEQVEGQKTTRWSTIEAIDGSYTRSIVDIDDQNFGSRLRHVFGIKYKDAATYAAWREAYLSFKASLVQYSD